MVIVQESAMKEGIALDQIKKKAFASLSKEIEYYNRMGPQMSSNEKVHIGGCLGYLYAVAQELNPLQVGGYSYGSHPNSLLTNDIEHFYKQLLLPAIAKLQKIYESGYGDDGNW